MIVSNLFNETISGAAYGASLSLAYGVLFNPAIGIGGAVIVGAISFASGKLFVNLTKLAHRTYLSEQDKLTKYVSVFVAGILGTYAGLHASNAALIALGFTVTIVPSITLALKVALAFSVAIAVIVITTQQPNDPQIIEK